MLEQNIWLGYIIYGVNQLLKAKFQEWYSQYPTNVIRRVLIMLWDDIGKPLSSFFILGGD